MSDNLTIHCDAYPNDTLDVEVIGKTVHLTICEKGMGQIALNRQSARELYDLLGEFLADDQR